MRNGRYATSTLPDGGRFVGPNQLKALLMQKRSQFARAFTEKMLTYALGRGLEAGDKCVVDSITKTVAAKGDRFSALVLGVVKSRPFQMNTKTGPAPATNTASIRTAASDRGAN